MKIALCFRNHTVFLQKITSVFVVLPVVGIKKTLGRKSDKSGLETNRVATVDGE